MLHHGRPARGSLDLEEPLKDSSSAISLQRQDAVHVRLELVLSLADKFRVLVAPQFFARNRRNPVGVLELEVVVKFAELAVPPPNEPGDVVAAGHLHVVLGEFVLDHVSHKLNRIGCHHQSSMRMIQFLSVLTMACFSRYYIR